MIILNRGIAWRLLFGFAISLVCLSSSPDARAKSSREEGRSASAPDVNGRPNILFILTDDQRWDAVGYAGNEVLKTPNLDELASQGARLDRFYVSNPVCMASRANLLTGRYLHEGVVNYVHPPRSYIHSGTPTVASYLKKAGYLTGFIGKVHLGLGPKRWGFDEIPLTLPETYQSGSRHIDPELAVDGRQEIVKGHITQILADGAIEFMDKHKEQRWFLWLATTAPHNPYHAFESHSYDRKEIEANPPPGWPDGKRLAIAKEGVFDWASYYSTISMLDEQIGRILKKLDELGLTSNTVVFFSSDNGMMLGSHGHMGKTVWYEEATRVPAVVRWPGKIEPGTIRSGLAGSVDILPTILEIAGIEGDRTLKGRSLVSLLTEGKPVRKFAFSEARRMIQLGGGFWQMVVKDHWKYVEFTDRRIEHLYDLSGDPHEVTDLIGDPKHRGIQQELTNILKEWRKPAGGGATSE